MKIYIDTCCYNRPYDDQTQERISAESAAIVSIIELCKIVGYPIVGSLVLLSEISEIKNVEKRRFIEEFYNTSVNEEIPLTGDIIKHARLLTQTQNLDDFDGLHLAAAIAAGADVLLTTDDDFEKRCSGLSLKIKVMNPVNFGEREV